MNAIDDESLECLLRLPAYSLAELGRALSSGTLRHGFSSQALRPFAGDQSPRVERTLCSMLDKGFTVPLVGALLAALGRALEQRDTIARSVQLVLSGPEVIGTPVVDTRTTVMSLFEEATEEVLVTSYVFHDAVDLFRRLAQKHDANPKLRVTFLVDISHCRQSSTDSMPALAEAFRASFAKQHWPGRRQPELWHDPRAFEVAAPIRGVLHAKTVIVDRKIAFVTSANFTGAAQSRNIEVGVLIRQASLAGRLHSYYHGLMTAGALRRIG